MLVVPRSIAGKVAAATWVAAALALLVFAHAQQHIHDMPEAFVWLLIFLTFPAGLVAVLVIGVSWASLSQYLGITYQPFYDLLPVWCGAVAIGYAQWFLFVPWLWSKVRHAKQRI